MEATGGVWADRMSHRNANVQEFMAQKVRETVQRQRAVVGPLLSVVIPSHKVGRRFQANLLQAASWASDEIEVIIRDDSGDPWNHEFMDTLDSAPNVYPIWAPATDEHDNFRSVLARARAPFVLSAQDDDYGFAEGVAAVLRAVKEATPDVIGVTGHYVIENPVGSAVCVYQGLTSENPLDRVRGYTLLQGPNCLFNSAVRTETIIETVGFFADHPIRFTFQDQVVSLMWLCAGRFIDIGRFLFVNDNQNWHSAEAGVAKDVAGYTRIGMDPSMRRLHWAICGLEGAMVALDRKMPESETIASMWLDTMFRRFVADGALAFDTPFDGASAKLRERWRGQYPRFDIAVMLPDLCDYIELFNKELATAYYNFWKR